MKPNVRLDRRDLTCRLRPFEWKRLGFHGETARVMAAEVETLERLGSMTREAFLAIPEIGDAALRDAERVLGRPLPRERRGGALACWAERGLRGLAARSLVQLGISTVEELRNCDPERLRPLITLSRRVRRQIERVLGIELPSHGTAFWEAQGLRMKNAMARAGYRSLADLAGVTREEFLAHASLGRRSLRRCEELLGRPLPRQGDV